MILGAGSALGRSPKNHPLLPSHHQSKDKLPIDIIPTCPLRLRNVMLVGILFMTIEALSQMILLFVIFVRSFRVLRRIGCLKLNPLPSPPLVQLNKRMNGKTIISLRNRWKNEGLIIVFQVRKGHRKKAKKKSMISHKLWRTKAIGRL
jgi:hypothetical protein